MPELSLDDVERDACSILRDSKFTNHFGIAEIGRGSFMQCRTGHHLGGDRLRHLGGIEARLAGSDLSVHRHLKKEVAKLLLYLGVVSRVDSLEQLVGLLEQVRPQGLVGLLAVPRASVRRAKLCERSISVPWYTSLRDPTKVSARP